jgi:hypothetical protein
MVISEGEGVDVLPATESSRNILATSRINLHRNFLDGEAEMENSEGSDG